MFDMGIGDFLNIAAALKEEQYDKRIEAILFACEAIKDYSVSELHYSKHFKYLDVLLQLLENDYYNALADVDFDVIYHLLNIHDD